jgi:hypothetical protein
MGRLENKLEMLFLEILCTTLLILLGIIAEFCEYTAQKSRYYTNSRQHLSLLCRAQSKLCDYFVITVFLKSVNIIFEDGDRCVTSAHASQYLYTVNCTVPARRAHSTVSSILQHAADV